MQVLSIIHFNSISGDNFCDFLFASQSYKTIPEGGKFLKEEFAPVGANSYFEEFTPVARGVKLKIEKLLPLNVNIITLTA